MKPPPTSKFLLHGPIMAGGLRAMGVITALGIIQLNVPTNHSLPPPTPPPGILSLFLFFSLYSMQGVGEAAGLLGQRAVWAGCSMTRSSGWICNCLAGGEERQ